MKLTQHSTTKTIATKAPIAAAIALISSVTYAQEFTLEEIVITAQKRSQSLQDVPISVSAMGGEKIAEAGIENLQDLSAYVPNLKIVEGGIVPQLFIRGIGSSANQGFDQSVGTYSDGIYMGRSLQSRASFMDLERVEVLRGPQGILFGQSAIAGAISLISAQPGDEFEANIGVSYAPEFNEREFNGVVSGPVSDTLSARLAVRDRQEDGYVKNLLLNTDAPALDEQAARVSLVWDANERLSASLKLEASDIERRGRQTQVIDLGIYPLVVPGLQDDAVLDYNTYSNEAVHMSFASENAVLKVEYDLGEHTLTSITGFSQYDYREDNYDGDNSEVPLISIDMSEDFEQFSQELRLSSPVGKTVEYMVAAFYQNAEQRYNEDASLEVSALGLQPAPGFPAFDSLVKRPFAQDSDTLAAFGQATWNIADVLRLTLGLRFTRDEKSGSREQNTYSLKIAPGALQSDIAIPNTPFTVADLLALNNDGNATPLPDGFRLVDHALQGKIESDNWTPSVNLQYDFNDNAMLYATYSEGYKAGGFDARGINGLSAGATDAFGRPYSVFSVGGDNFEFAQEEASTFELGAKMSLLEGTAELNVALYQTDYTDMQVSVFDGTFGFTVLNAGEATVRGLEMDGRWQPSANLLFTSGLAYLDFEWTDYKEGACPGEGHSTPSPSGSGNCVYDGLENNHTPTWTFNVSANHTYALGERFELRSTLDANFKSSHFVANTLDARSEQPSTTIINARLALASMEDTWQIALSAKNLSDREVINYATNLSQSRGGLNAQIGRPRTVAIEGTYRF